MKKGRKPKEVLILGAGSFGEEILDCMDEINCIQPTYKCIGFLDDDEKKREFKLRGIPVLGSLSDSSKYPDSQLISALASIKTFWKREILLSGIEKKLNRFETILHPAAVVSSTASIGSGTIISSHVTIGPNVKIGNHVVILPNTVVNHDVRIEDYSIIASGVNISGKTTVESCCYLGSGCVIKENLTIEECCLIGMGSVILNNVIKNSVMVGSPGRKIRAVVES